AAPARHTQPLPALGALEIPMGLAVGKAHAGVSQTVLYRSPPAQELLVFRIARLDIAREHAEIAQDEQRQNEHAHPALAGEHLDHDQHQPEDQQRCIELVIAIAPCHETTQKVHYSGSSFLTWSKMSAST